MYLCVRDCVNYHARSTSLGRHIIVGGNDCAGKAVNIITCKASHPMYTELTGLDNKLPPKRCPFLSILP